MIRQFEGRFSQVHIIENSLDWAEAAADTAAAPGETPLSAETYGRLPPF